jgi:triacylglycerol lipase
VEEPLVRRLSSLLLLCLAVAAACVSPAAAAGKYPVTYNFLPYAITGGLQYQDAPGSNDWSCTPSAHHPRPVVLVHGTFGNKTTNWQTYAPLLANHGYCVFALTYGQDPSHTPVGDEFGGMTRMQDSAKELKAFVDRVLKATGTDQVDIVGHSQGTLMPDYYVKFLGGAKHVHRYVSLAPLWHGTATADPGGLSANAFGAPSSSTPFCVSCGQMATGSSFMKKMRKGGVAVPGVRYTNIMTKYDELVSPYTSGREKGMRNLVVQDFCATDYTEHFEMAADPVAARIVLNTLDPAHRKKVPCTYVAPFVGPPPS